LSASADEETEVVFMRFLLGSVLFAFLGSQLTSACVGAVPSKSVAKKASTDSIFDDNDDDNSFFDNEDSGDDNLDAKPAVESGDASAKPELIPAETERPSREPRTARVPISTLPSLRWIAMGDFGETNLSGLEECVDSMNVQRSPCAELNSRCVSSFETSCSSPEGCRRLFKCVTGQTNTLAWFPMGDGVTLSTAQGAAPSYGLCSISADIAGRECSSVNSRCLSSFCTSGSGNDCGRRVFKCLTTGVAGRYFYRWMGDKSEAELAGVGECALQTNIAGSECFSENSTCKSSFQTGSGGRRLFKCTP